jgi:hypothetical protein
MRMTRNLNWNECSIGRAAFGPLVLLYIVMTSAPAGAHEYWLAADRYTARRGDPVSISAWVGTGFRGEPKLYAASRTAQLDVQSDRRIDLSPLAAEADSHFCRVSAPDDSGMVVAFVSNFSVIELEAPRFEAYLNMEGLEEIVRIRHQRGESNKPGKERYRRCAKAWITGPASPGTGAADRMNRPDAHRGPTRRFASRAGTTFGLPLEIVPLGDPTGAGPVTVRLLFEGHPKSGALVRAWRAPLGAGGGAFRTAERDSTGPVVEVRTDPRGEARLDIAGAGEWLVSAVVMIPSRKVTSDWESCWASLTFGRPH